MRTGNKMTKKLRKEGISNVETTKRNFYLGIFNLIRSLAMIVVNGGLAERLRCEIVPFC